MATIRKRAQELQRAAANMNNRDAEQVLSLIRELAEEVEKIWLHIEFIIPTEE